MLLSYCVVNTNGRDYLPACLDAIEANHPAEVEHETLVLDNASDDGSLEALRGRPGVRVIALARRAGKAENDSTLLREARGRHCLLLNEDSELRPGAARALLDALEADPGAAAAAAQLLTTDGREKACAWREPDLLWALSSAVGLHNRVAVESRGGRVREVAWAQSSALLVRRAAAEAVGFLDPDFFVYSDETDFCRRLRDGGWRVLYVPAARAVHHDQLSTDPVAVRRRIVEFHRGRDLYMRKHHSTPERLACRALWAWFYAVRLLVARLRREDPLRYRLHLAQELVPRRGQGIREAAAAHNRRLAARAGDPAAGGAAGRAD